MKEKKSKLPTGTECTLCGHVYIFPCNGERYYCANAVWVRSKGTIDIGKLSVDELKTFKKSKEKLPNVVPQTEKQKSKRRVRL